MVEQTMTIRESMSLDTFDPMDIDISEFQTLSKELPVDTNLDMAIAERLAITYLRAADRCSEINSGLIWYITKLKQDKNTTRQKLYLLAKDEGHKTVEDKKAYAESHPDYVALGDKLVNAEAVRKWFEDKHKWFLETHRFMKAKLKSESQHMLSSGFSEVAGVEKDGSYGEKPW